MSARKNHPQPEQKWLYRRGDLTRGSWQSVVDGDLPGWEHTGLRIAQLSPGDELLLTEEGVERIIVPLSGSFTVRTLEGFRRSTIGLDGRSSVFDGPTDILYLNAKTKGVLSGHGRVAICSSPTTEVKPTRYVAASTTPIELRGAGTSSRQVHNFGTPGALDAARLIVCEVITPAGNWSSYPPHKHDESVPGHESKLEEIYYFESEPTAGSTASNDSAFGLFHTYSSDAGEIEIDAIVRSGDIALVPYGYHGPAVAAPGYDLYYLNVMAGPDAARAWLISDDPAYASQRDAWTTQAIDDRLPYAKQPSTREVHV